MRVMITGAAGFVAPYLHEELRQHGHAVFLTSESVTSIRIKGAKVPVAQCKLTQPTQIKALLHKIKPNAVVHLGALSKTGPKYDLSDYVRNNVDKTESLCRALTATKRKIHFLYVSSAMVYGNQYASEKGASETTPPYPASPYGKSKLMAEKTVLSFVSRLFKPTLVRPFNHVGPGQSTDFACAAFAERIAKIPNGGTIEVGNLEAERDFTDVRDMARAYRLILEKTPKEELFVLGRGRSVRMAYVLKEMIRLSKKKIRIKIKKSLSSSATIKSLKCDPSLAHEKLGWAPKYSIQESLKDIYTVGASKT